MKNAEVIECRYENQDNLMKLLITGGAGFIGSALIRYLIQNTTHSVLNIAKLNYAGHPEALDTGAIALTGLDSRAVIDGVRVATTERSIFSSAERELPEEYAVRNTSERLVRLITGTAGLARHWLNMDDFSRYDW